MNVFIPAFDKRAMTSKSAAVHFVSIELLFAIFVVEGSFKFFKRGTSPDLTIEIVSCDAEPIHIPGSIQPQGFMLIADVASKLIVGYAARGEDRVDSSVVGLSLDAVIDVGTDVSSGPFPATGAKVIGDVSFAGTLMDAVAFRSGEHLVVEVTDKGTRQSLDASFLAELQSVGGALERSSSLNELCQQAARAFQGLTGYSRVMVYRFIDDDAGVVVGESLSGPSSSFMNHHFPASDIPRQARALYVRNPVRVIADVNYTPVPIVGIDPGLATIDLSDSTLRSVSPIHIQYLKNMGVAASASMSIVMDGVLWGLVACHHHEPRSLTLTTRLACQALAAGLSRQIKAREENELYRERIRLRSQEDVILAELGSEDGLSDFLDRSGAQLARLLQADGFAALCGSSLFVHGECPDPLDVHDVAKVALSRGVPGPWVTNELSRELPSAGNHRELASGLLASVMSSEEPIVLMWFRAEQLQTVKWAGNPHANVALTPGATLMPRASFEAWAESVRGRSREWSLAEVESCARIVRQLLETRNNQRVRRLNRELTATLRENESLLSQKDFLLQEVNHRVQNSLSLVSSFLRMQRRGASADVKTQLEEAERRLTAVSLVYRRLYQADSISIIDLSRYLGELCTEILTAMDKTWASHITLDLAPVLVTTDRAISIGLIVNELITNVTKYAYRGAPGPLTVTIEQHRDMLRVVVSDHGEGKGPVTKGTGFGSRMLGALIDQLQGRITYVDNAPGLRAVVSMPVIAPGTAKP
ncbi:GAF domain-containing protein [Kaistia defluvii]|uniref:histidine kinase dimerization/phosphoacceptor domain -containing protein n=1 Tax=Kaistia defluvii TaxID=410841 RepID=UPI0022552BAE|nr:histidine kinase dimerization/phosphoacceptor domain -containing protein [Kaistia defluvii]MCX5519505.1 GAF domain-containing protein [Kaistia defluvii]